MNKEFIPYEEALALKELGFDEECLGWFRDKLFTLEEKGDYFVLYGLEAPLYQQAFRWFREKYGLHHNISNDKFGYYTNEGKFDTYEQAELTCLRKLIEIVKQR